MIQTENNNNEAKSCISRKTEVILSRKQIFTQHHINYQYAKLDLI